MNLTATSLYSLSFFFLISLVSAAELEITAPSSVLAGENFTVKIQSNITDRSDVKIYIQNSELKIFSEIFDKGWKSSFYYILDSYPDKLEYSLQATNPLENGEICAKLRKTVKKTIISSPCRSITITQPQQQVTQEPQQQQNNQQDNNVQNNSPAPITAEENPPVTEKTEVKNTVKNPASKTNADVSLNQLSTQAPPAATSNPTQPNVTNLPADSIKKTSNQGEYITNQEKTRLITIYAFTVLVLLIVVLFVLNKL